jgi:WXG100 family type VII secretion target
MSEVRLLHDAMSRAIAETRAARERLSADRRAAQRRVDSFLGSGWQGIANDAFSEAWGEWLESADRVEDGLEAMADLIQAHHRDMVEQDEESQRAMDDLAARIVDRLG